MSAKKQRPQPGPTSRTEATPEPAIAPAEADTKRKRTLLACGGCGVLFVLALLITIIALTAWGNKDSRLYKGKPLPTNVAYIGRWISDGTIGACLDTFAIAGPRIACDFSIRNDSQQEITVQAIGRTIIGPMIEDQFVMTTLAPELMAGDQPMRITDDENVLGLQLAMGGQWLMVEPSETARANAKPPEPFTLKPGQVKRVRYRPKANQMLMPASVLRIAVALNDGSPLHVFYFLRKSAGIEGWFEKRVETAVSGGVRR